MIRYKTYYTLCAQTVHLFLQALSGNCARASLSGHTRCEALCSLDNSQRGQ